MTWSLLLPLLALTAPSQGLSVVSPACARCVQPEFPPGSGRALYLPHCVQGVTHNYCDAVCSGEQVRAHIESVFIVKLRSSLMSVMVRWSGKRQVKVR